MMKKTKSHVKRSRQWESHSGTGWARCAGGRVQRATGPWQNAKFTSAKFPIQCPLFDSIATTIPGIANFLFTARPKLR